MMANNKKNRGKVAVLTWGIILGMLPGLGLAAGELSEPYLLALGGRLYDNWSVVLNIKPPKTTHPAYPATGKEKGSGTWRCKTCHGWDYLGRDGRFASGEHASGIQGIQAWKGRDPAAVVALLRDKVHGYTPKMLPDEAAHALGMFVAKGQVDMAKYIDAQGKGRGDPKRGIQFFQTICAFCHGLDGKKINFGTQDNPEGLGATARENPWEVIHKMLNGQPGKEMISLRMLPELEPSHIVSYEQTLPQ